MTEEERLDKRRFEAGFVFETLPQEKVERLDPELNEVPFVRGDQLIYNLGKRRSVREVVTTWWRMT